MTGTTTSNLERLSPLALGSARPNVSRPAYDRALLRGGIVHLGIGAFARAHLAAVNEAAITGTGDMRFGIVGISLRSSETRDALEPQAGLYTLALRDADPLGRPRQQVAVIGNLIGLMVAPEDPAAVVSRIAHPETRILSLTVTEKGYCVDPASGRLMAEHPDIAHDLLHPDRPRSAIGMIVRGMQRRRQLGLGPVTLMSLDNLPSNGQLLRRLVVDLASRVDAELADWIHSHCTFPNSMVDRIVPRTAAADRASVTAALGLVDAWPVVAEPYLAWAVEDHFCAGRPNWDLGGAHFVEAASSHERLKLRMVNASHSALAYLAASAGVPTVDAAMGMAHMRAYLQQLMRDEIAPTLGAIPGVDLAAYQGQLLVRFANPALAHRTHQIAMDGSQKLPQRWLATARARLADQQPMPLLALAIAGWLRYLNGRDEAGGAYSVHDPLAPELERVRAEADRLAKAIPDAAVAERVRVSTMLQFAPIFGDLGDSQAFVDAVAAQALSLRQLGIAATLAAVVARSQRADDLVGIETPTAPLS